MNDYLSTSQSDLKTIEEEIKKTKFLEWASQNIKCLRKMNEGELINLRRYYENVLSWKEVDERTFELSMNFNTIVDYKTDLHKNKEKLDLAKEYLINFIQSLYKKYGIEEEFESTINSPISKRG